MAAVLDSERDNRMRDVRSIPVELIKSTVQQSAELDRFRYRGVNSAGLRQSKFRTFETTP